MDNRDLISELPQNVIQLLLTKLPINDAVGTSILSRSWRYSWGILNDLVFDDGCATHQTNGLVVVNRLVNFVTYSLLLHNGPINLFSLRTAYLETSPQVDQWILFLSRKDIKEIVLELGPDDWYPLPTSLFSCKELRRLELVRCRLKSLPPEFTGFLRLEHIKLEQVISPTFDVECLISSCPVLKSLQLSYFSNLLDLQMSSISLASTSDANSEFLDARPHWVFNHLKNVEMTDILGMPRELNFIKYLLQRSPALEVMRIRVSPYVPERRLEIAEKIMDYPRASAEMFMMVDT